MDLARIAMATLRLVLLALCVISAVSASVIKSGRALGPPVVQTNAGKVQGSVQTTEAGESYYSFLGIPYAEAPVGDLRFKAPVAKAAWDSTFDATPEPTPCYQPIMTDGVPIVADGTEDCLTLNVFTPVLPSADKPNAALLPVQVFIHGGAFFIGTSVTFHYGPEYYMNGQDTILIYFSYRLGALGFLSTFDTAAPGNAGLLDQLLVLQWVQDNIAAFGGDPNAVTISGESAGAVSVLGHILSPMSKGLFHQAIAESGTALCPWGWQENPLHYAQLLGKAFDCPQDDTAALVDCLRDQPPDQISLKEVDVMVENLTLAFVPSVEPKIGGQFITEDPLTTLTNGDFNQVPIIMGFNRDEGSIIYKYVWFLFADINDAFFNDLVPLALTALTDYRTNLLNVSYAIKAEYYDPIDLNDQTVVTRTNIDLLSDMFMRPWVVQNVDLFSSRMSTYFYYFTYVGDFSLTNFTGGPDVVHTEELLYLFNVSDSSPPLSARDTTFSNGFVELWRNFIKSGNPTDAWPATPAGSHQYYDIDTTNSVKPNYDPDRIKFWLETVPAIVNA